MKEIEEPAVSIGRTETREPETALVGEEKLISVGLPETPVSRDEDAEERDVDPTLVLLAEEVSAGRAILPEDPDNV